MGEPSLEEVDDGSAVEGGTEDTCDDGEEKDVDTYEEVEEEEGDGDNERGDIRKASSH